MRLASIAKTSHVASVIVNIGHWYKYPDSFSTENKTKSGRFRILGFFLYRVCIVFRLINSWIPDSHKHRFQFDLQEKTENNIQTKQNAVYEKPYPL